MFKCKDIGYRASDYLAGEMNLSERVRFRLHLSICRNCQRFMQQMHLLHDTLPQHQFPEPDDTQIEKWVKGLSE